MMGGLTDFLFPRRCVLCGKLLEADEPHLCRTCTDDIPFTRFEHWRENPAEKILWGRTRFEWVCSLFYYRRESIYSRLTPMVKYGGKRSLGLHLGEMLGRRMQETGLLDSIDTIVPVPLHPVKKWFRGYNQAEIISRGIVRGAGGRPDITPDILRRDRLTASQTRTDVGNKWENVSDAFSVSRKYRGLLKGQHILVVDDVLTTGATAEACWNALSAAGCTTVSFASLAFVER